jgi:type III secretory pathway component EscS
MVHHERALSDMVAQILIIFLIVLVTLLIIASLTGVLTKFLQKPALPKMSRAG